MAFPVKVLLHQSRLRYYVDRATAESMTVFWPELTLPPPTSLSDGDFFEVSAQKHQFSRLDPTQQPESPVYHLPRISGSLELKSIHQWILTLHSGDEWQHTEPALSVVASELVARITGSERFNTFRLSEPMQKLKRDRNEFARALSLSSDPATSRHLLGQLMNSVTSIKEQEAVAKEVLYAMTGALVSDVRRMIAQLPAVADSLDPVLMSILKQTPLREARFSSSIEPVLRERLAYTLQGLRERWMMGQIKLPEAVQLIQKTSAQTSSLNPVELTDLLHQTFERKLTEQVNLLHHMVECVHSFPQDLTSPTPDSPSQHLTEQPASQRPRLRF